MASGGISFKELEESISCPVCWDLYREPHSLLCLHSVCKRCVDFWAKDGIVTCPQCRTVTPQDMLKLDFKIQAVVEWFKKEEQRRILNSPEPSENQELSEQPEFCDLCDTTKAGLFCHDCEKVLCLTCQRAHSKIAACSIENTERLSVASARQTKVVEEQLVALSEASTGLEKEFERVKVECAERETDALTRIQQAREEAKAAVDEHFRHEEEMLRHTTKMWRDKSELTHSILDEKIKRCLHGLENLKLAKPSKIVEKSNELETESKECTQMVHTAVFPNVKIDLHQLENSLASLKAALATSVSVEGLQAQGSRGCFQQLTGNKVHFEKKVELRNGCGKMVVVNEELWCLGEGFVDIYHSQTGEHIETMKINLKFSWASTVGPTGEDILIAAGGLGLKWLKTDGSNELVHIHDGMFYSVCRSGEHFYAVREDNRFMFLDTFIKDGAGFIRSESVLTELHCGPHSIAVMNNQIFISGYDCDVVCRLDFRGRIIQAWGQPGFFGPGELYHPWLCESDASGCLLVCDTDNYRLQVLQPENEDQPWAVVDIDRNIRPPIAPFLTKERKLFVSGYTPTMAVHRLPNQEAI